jgi:MFS family permease
VALSSLRPFSSRNFSLFWSSALISNVGTWMQTVALGTLITLREHNALWTALVMAAAFIPMGLFGPIGGVLADRMDRRRWLIITTIAEAFFAVVLTVVVFTNHDPPWVLVLLAFLGGSSGAVGFPAYQAILPELVEREDLLAAVSLSSAQWNMGRVIGPALAGIVLVIWSPAAAFFVNAISFGAVVVALCLVRLPHHERAPDGASLRARLIGGARIAFGEPGCRSSIFLISVVAFFGSPFIGLIAALAIDGLHRKAGGPAVLTTGQGIGAVIGALAMAPAAKAFGQRIIVTVGLFAFCGALVLYGLSGTLPLAALAIAAVGGTYIWALSGLNTVIQLRAPEAARGRVLSIYMMALGIIYPIGLIVQGALGQVLGIRTVTVFSGIFLAAGLALLGLARPETFSSLAVPRRKLETPLDVMMPEVAEADLAGLGEP